MDGNHRQRITSVGVERGCLVTQYPGNGEQVAFRGPSSRSARGEESGVESRVGRVGRPQALRPTGTSHMA